MKKIISVIFTVAFAVVLMGCPNLYDEPNLPTPQEDNSQNTNGSGTTSENTEGTDDKPKIIENGNAVSYSNIKITNENLKVSVNECDIECKYSFDKSGNIIIKNDDYGEYTEYACDGGAYSFVIRAYTGKLTLSGGKKLENNKWKTYSYTFKDVSYDGKVIKLMINELIS